MSREETLRVARAGFLRLKLNDMTKWSESILSTTSMSWMLMSSLAINQSSVCPLRWVGTLMCWTRWRVGKSDFSDFTLGSELESKWRLMSPITTSFRHLVVRSSSSSGNSVMNWVVFSWFFLLGGGSIETQDSKRLINVVHLGLTRFKWLSTVLLTWNGDTVVKSVTVQDCYSTCCYSTITLYTKAWL